MSLPPYLLPTLIEKTGTSWRFDAYVVGIGFDRRAGRAAFALGDGTLRLVDLADPAAAPAVAAAHDGGLLSFAADPRGGFVSGGDDGRLVHTAADGAVSELHRGKGAWIDQLAVAPDGMTIAFAGGKTVNLLGGQRQPLGGPLVHPSSVGGLAFDPRGKRLFAAHYNGVSAWWANAQAQQPRLLKWTGSHLGATVSPDGRFLVTAMQENALHGWRLADGADMRMTGYPAKTHSLSWMAKGRFLATSGSGSVVCWPFQGKDGPMGKPPLEMGGDRRGVITRVAAHPAQDVVAAGFDDGFVALYRVENDRRVDIRRAGDGPVTALAWSADGRFLALGTEDGFAGLIGFGG
ncbi:MAG: WD40 repeat domain-containing protein [Thalassobaculales bacterium]